MVKNSSEYYTVEELKPIYDGDIPLEFLMEEMYRKSMFYKTIHDPAKYKMSDTAERFLKRKDEQLQQDQISLIMSGKVQPCPFCGRTPSYSKDIETTFMGGIQRKVKLECCITMIQDYGMGGVFYTSPGSCNSERQALNSLIERWNKRH